MGTYEPVKRQFTPALRPTTHADTASKRADAPAPIVQTSAVAPPDSARLAPISILPPATASTETDSEGTVAPDARTASEQRKPHAPIQTMKAAGGVWPPVGPFGSAPVQRKNVTGLPDALKHGVEALSGIALDDVRVHYNSAKPAAVEALAYTQGTEIHVGPGGERHLAHEAWHVVQQRQGRVQPTLRVNGVAVNDDRSLEREATDKGTRAQQISAIGSLMAAADHSRATEGRADAIGARARPVQRMRIFRGPKSIRIAKEKETVNVSDTRDYDDSQRAALREILRAKKLTGLLAAIEEEWSEIDKASGKTPASGLLGTGSPTLTQQLEQFHPSKIKGAWLFYNHPSTAKKGYFWKPDPEKMGDPDPAPTIWAKDFRRLEEPGDYYTLDQPLKRGGGLTEALTMDEYRIRTKGSQPREASDHYNPFGRFAKSDYTSFIPHLNDVATGAVLKELADNDDSFISPNLLDPIGGNTDSGYPRALRSKDGKITLKLVGEHALGAHYASAPVADTMAARSRPATLFPLPVKGAVQTAKVLTPLKITKETINAWSGEDRSEQQRAVMGQSAADIAHDAGFTRDEGKGWEWLHLVAHGMGGIEQKGPQVPENLVAGTHEANSQMIVVEEFLKDVVVKTGGYMALFVGATMLDPVRHIGDTIVYDAVLYGADDKPIDSFHWTFNCLSRAQPESSANRQVRYAGRAMAGVLGDKETPGFGESGLVAKPKITGSAESLPEMIVSDWEWLKSDPDDFMSAMFDHGKAVPADPQLIVTAVHWVLASLPKRALAPEACAQFIEGAVKYHPQADFLHALVEALVKSFGGPQTTPQWAIQPFVEIFTFMGAHEIADLLVNQLGTDAAQHARTETQKSGNCLYEAINIVLGNAAEMDATLRELATDYFLDHPGLAQNAGLDVDSVVTTLSTPGRWAGNAGDLAPVVLASVIRRNIVIVTDAVIYEVESTEPTVGRDIILFLANGHYTVNPVTDGQKQGSGTRKRMTLKDKLTSNSVVTM